MNQLDMAGRHAVITGGATERTAFVLRHFEGHTLEHIGATLGISLAATKQCVFRAVRKVRQDLEPLVQAS